MTEKLKENQAAKSVDSIDWLEIIKSQKRYDIETCQYYGDATMEPCDSGDYIHYNDLMNAIDVAISSANSEHRYADYEDSK